MQRISKEDIRAALGELPPCSDCGARGAESCHYDCSSNWRR